MNRFRFAAGLLLFAATSVALVGCTEAKSTPAGKSAAAEKSDTDPDVAAERAKLSPEDLALVEAQEWCVISSDERLGSMGPPIKLSIKGEPVFVCCKGCQKKAEANPDRTLAKVEELKAKAKAEKTPQK
jgi:hypothetical protein